MKKLFLIILFLEGWGNTAWAEKIIAYEVNITVEQSGELAIIESITYDFEQQQKHGIFRDIPFTVEGKIRPKEIGLYDFSILLDGAAEAWEKSIMASTHAGDVVRLKIGSPSLYRSGKHIYTIAYRVKKGVLPAATDKNEDAIRWNIVGTGWQIPIYDIKAHIFLPSSLSQKIITPATFTGSYGTKTSEATAHWATPQILQISLASLRPHEGLTIELAYPAYRLDQHGHDNVKAAWWEWILEYWQWGALAGFLLYFKKSLEKYTGFIDKRSIAVQYAAPKGLSLLQSGLILDHFADDKDFAAAILELAALGYLTIEQQGSNDDPVLIQTGIPLDDKLTMDQKYLLNHIFFKSGKQFILSSGSQTKAKSLLDGFRHINDQLYIWVVGAGYMSENPQRLRKNFLIKSILYLLPVLGFTLYDLVQKSGSEILVVLFFPLIFGVAGMSTILGSKTWAPRLFGVLFMAGGMIPLIAVIQTTPLTAREIFAGPLGVLLILILALAYTYKKIGKFTQQGAQARTHLLGLQMFIKRAKQDEIKKRLQLDPLYLEKMLPYAILFGEIDHWLSLFSNLNIAVPHWYAGDIKNLKRFASSVHSASLPPSGSTSGGSGFSGRGGFSGGGGGGGGGGSW